MGASAKEFRKGVSEGAKDDAAQLAQNARLQASLAEAEAIAARERMRASDTERKLADMAELLSSATAREEALRKVAESGGVDPAKRTEFIDQSLELARLNARLVDAEAALVQARSQASGQRRSWPAKASRALKKTGGRSWAMALSGGAPSAIRAAAKCRRWKCRATARSTATGWVPWA